MNPLKNYFKLPLIYRVGAAFVLGIVLGVVLSLCKDASWVGTTVKVLSPFGTVLVSMLKMIVFPIIFFSLVMGAANLPLKKFGKLGTGVLLWYFCTSVFAAIFGCALALGLNPSMKGGVEQAVENVAAITAKRAEGAGNGSFAEFINGLFTNPFEALASGNFLAIIIFSLLFGIAARVVLDRATDSQTVTSVNTMLNIFDAAQKACFKIIDWIMEYFPIGVFALTAVNFAQHGVDLFGPYLQIAGCVIFGVLLMIFVIYPLIIYVFTRENPYKLLFRIKEPIITAFLTRSSAATLPISFKAAEQELHVKKELSSFALPLGATINMDGVCLHLPVFAILAANMFGIEMSPVQLAVLVVSIVFASVGAGGIPGGSVFLLFMVLANMGLDEGQTALVAALALGINPLLDMFETACNVTGDNVCNYIIAKHNDLIEKTNAADSVESSVNQ